MNKDKMHFQCSGCKVRHYIPLYALVQLAMGNDMTFTCKEVDPKTHVNCGAKTFLDPVAFSLGKKPFVK